MEQPHNFLTVEEFNDLLKKWNDNQIKVSKLEMNDLDEIVMHLTKIGYESEAPTIDGYEPTHSLKLNGEGMIQTDNNDARPLPSSLYEIPIGDDTLYKFDGTNFLIHTNRGTYKIERVNEGSL